MGRIRGMPHTGNTMSQLLWKPESWLSRLEELEARAGDLKEAPLRRDVRSLGVLLGEVLREQAGEDLYAHVEALRQGTIVYDLNHFVSSSTAISAGHGPE